MSWKLSAAATAAIFQNLSAPPTGEIISNLTDFFQQTVNKYLVWCIANIHKVALLVPWFEHVMHMLMENFFNEFNFSQKVVFYMLFWQG